MPFTRTPIPNALDTLDAVPAEALVSQIYAFLRNILDSVEIEPTFARDLKQLLREAESNDRRHSKGAACLLPLLACGAMGEDPQRALPAAAAWRALDVAAKVLDDVEDGDAIRELGQGQSARVLNTAPGYYAASVLCLSQLPQDVYIELSGHLQRTIFRMAGAQHRGFLVGPKATVEECLQGTGEKTGSSFGLAARFGGRCATSDSRSVDSLEEFGFNAGIVLQLLDDLADFHMPGPDGDIAGGRRTIPIVYAVSVAAPEERCRLETLLEQAPSDSVAEEGARRAMLEMGAHSYLLAEIARYRRRALDAIEGMGAEGRSVLRLRDWLSWLETAAANR